MKKKFDVRRLVIDSMFAAITGLLYCTLKFPLPIFPSFLEFNFSMIPVMIILFMFGIFDALGLLAIRLFVKMIFMGTATAYVGELADLIIGTFTVLSAFFAYKLARKKFNISTSTIISLAFASLGWTISAMLANWLMLIPAYIHIAKFPKSAIIGMCDMIPGINSNNFMALYIFVGVLPFNLILSIIINIITYIVHMRTYKIFDESSVDQEIE